MEALMGGIFLYFDVVNHPEFQILLCYLKTLFGHLFIANEYSSFADDIANEHFYILSYTAGPNTEIKYNKIRDLKEKQ
jgi:hypothetical protein